jgi:hypothetical protein
MIETWDEVFNGAIGLFLPKTSSRSAAGDDQQPMQRAGLLSGSLGYAAEAVRQRRLPLCGRTVMLVRRGASGQLRSGSR